MFEASQTIPELVMWVKEREFSLKPSYGTLGIFTGGAIYNNERLDGAMLETI